MIISKFCRAAAILSAALLFFTVSSVRAAIPPAENLLPADTLVMMTIPDFSKARADAHESPQWLFWNDPAMKPFHDKFVSGLNDALIGPLEADLGVKIENFEDLPQGQLTFAISRNGWDGKDDHSLGIIFLLDARDKADLLKANLAVLEKKWTDGGKTIRTQTVRGVPFSVVMISSNDIPGALTNLYTPRPQTQELGRPPELEKPHELVVGQFGSLLVMGNSIEAVDPIVAHLTGSEMPALADDSTFAADKMARFHGAPLYYAWFDAKTYFGILAATPPPEPNPDAPTIFPPMQWNKAITALGLTGVKSICFSYYDTREGAQANIFIAAPEATRQGLLKMFAPESRTAVPPAFVPADATKFVRWRIDGQQAWKTLQDMLNNISPSATIGLNAAIDMANANAQQKNPGFDIRKNLFDNLGDDFIRYEKSPAKSAANPLAAPSLFLFSVHNGDGAVAAITTLASMVGSGQTAPAPRAFLGHKIFTIPLPGAGMAGGPAASPRFIYYAAGDGYVALTTDVSMLESYLRSAANPPKPLSGLPGLIDAAQHVGGTGNGVFGFQNQRELLRTLFNTLNAQSPDAMSAFGPMFLLPKGLRDTMDFSLLPDYDAVSKYFYITVYSGSSTPNGISFETFTPRPPQLD
jgi:hypothetical protein